MMAERFGLNIYFDRALGFDLESRYPAIGQTILGLKDQGVQKYARKFTSLVLVGSEELMALRLLKDSTQVASGLIDWVKDPGHGANHAANVFSAALALREKDPQYYRVTDEILFLYSGLHDLAEFLPYVDNSGNIYPTERSWRFRYHAPLVSRLIQSFFPALNIDGSKNIAKDLLLHDYYNRFPTHDEAVAIQNELSLAGKLLIDADRFGGAGPLNVETSALDTIKRAREGCRGKWYMFRDTLTLDDRLDHKGRMEGHMEGLSGSLKEVFGYPTYLANTEAGKAFLLDRKPYFEEALINYLLEEYGRERPILLQAWKTGEVFIGLDHRGTLRQLENMKRITLLHLPFDEALAQLVLTPVPTDEISPLHSRPYFGYSLRVGETLYDPSFLKFAKITELEAALRQATQDYKNNFERTAV